MAQTQFYVVKYFDEVFIVALDELERFLGEYYEEQRVKLEVQKVTLTDWYEV